MRVRNTSDQEQHFTSIGTFAPKGRAGDDMTVDDATGEYLLKSPHIVKADEPVRGTEPKSTKTFKGVERSK